MELRHLRYFIAVAEHLHFGRAAQVLRTAQPSLSQQIRNLEREVGVPLLERDRHHVRLTAAGYAFLGEARALVSRSERSIALARETAAGRLGTVRVAFPVAALGTPLIHTLQAFAAERPNVALSARVLSDRDQLEELIAERIDAAFGHEVSAGEASALGLKCEPVLATRLVVALPRRHGLAERDRLRVEELRGERLLALDRRAYPVLFARVLDLCGTRGYDPPSMQEVADETALIALVGAGLGVALVPSGLGVLRPADVVFRPLSPAATIRLAVYTRADSPNTALREFLAVGYASTTPPNHIPTRVAASTRRQRAAPR